MCAQYIKQGNIFGRIGTGIGKGLAEQVPKEIERSRLAAGLKQLGEEEGLTPFQQFSRLSSIPGVTPQMLQSGAELLRQQGIARGFNKVANKSGNKEQESIFQNRSSSQPQLKKELQRQLQQDEQQEYRQGLEGYEKPSLNRGVQQELQEYRQGLEGYEKPSLNRDELIQTERNAFSSALNDQNKPKSSGLQTRSKGLTTAQSTQAALSPYIPKTREEIVSRASELYDENRELYPNPEMALAASAQEDAQFQAISNAQQAARQSQIAVEERVINKLENLRKSSNAEIPDNVYQQVENKVLEEVAAGKNELEAAKEGAKKLDLISRDYNAVDSLGNLTFLLNNPKHVNTAYKGLQKSFAERNDLENLADTMVAKNGLSNEYAYYRAIPPPREIRKYISDLPSIKPKIEAVPGSRGLMSARGVNKKDQKKKTEEVIKHLTSIMGKNDSPLAIGYELSEKGYDSNLWRNYLIDHKDELNLSVRQVRELQKVDKGFQGILNDTFLKVFGGE